MLPSARHEFLNTVQEVCKHNFLISSITPTRIKSLAYGNFHEMHKAGVQFTYSKHTADEFKTISNQLIKQFKLDSEQSKGHCLHAYLSCPRVLRMVYKLAKTLSCS